MTIDTYAHRGYTNAMDMMGGGTMQNLQSPDTEAGASTGTGAGASTSAGAFLGAIGAARAGTATRRAARAELGDRIAEHAFHLDAAMLRLLADVRAFDAAGYWADEGAASCPAWLSWRVGWTPGTGREHVRVARALGSLPRIDDALRAGRLSYSKIRAITRVATPATEEALRNDALLTTAAQLETICRKLRREHHRKADQPGAADAEPEHQRAALAAHRGSGVQHDRRWLRRRRSADGPDAGSGRPCAASGRRQAGDRVLEGVQHLVRRREPLAGQLGHRAQNDGVERGRDAGDEGARSRRSRRGVGQHQRPGR